MKFLHISDLHIGKYLGETSLLEDQKYFLEKLCDLAKEKECSAVVIAGDIYQRSVPSSDAILVFEEFLDRLINRMQISVIMISGNHDSPERIGFGSSLFDSSRLAIAGRFTPKISRVTFSDEFGDINFFMLPYLEPHTVGSVLKDKSIQTYNDAYKTVMSLDINLPDKNSRNVILAHGYFARSGRENESVFSESERSIGGSDCVDVAVFDRFDYGAFGHLHAPQRAGGEFMRYSGSMLKYSLSESTQNKSVCFVEMREKGNIILEQIEIKPLRDVRILSGYLDDILESNRLAGENFDDYIFAELHDEHVFDAMSRLRGIFPNMIGLRFKQSIGEDIFVPKGMEETSKIEPLDLFRSFYTAITGEDITDSRTEIAKNIMEEIESGDFKK